VGWLFAPAGLEVAEAVAADPIDTSNPAQSKAAITMFRCLYFTSKSPFMVSRRHCRRLKPYIGLRGGGRKCDFPTNSAPSRVT
jgi:hypothetical protein